MVAVEGEGSLVGYCLRPTGTTTARGALHDPCGLQVLVCQVLNEKTELARERSSRRIAEWFRDEVLDRPKLQNLRMLKAKAKRAMEMTKGRIAELIGEPDLLRQVAIRSTFLATINTVLNI
uniref:Uncharacterized protein n=1 Tax=Solanum tuberosum TaxID=4113 RepID=M1DXR1_SOLTU